MFFFLPFGAWTCATTTMESWGGAGSDRGDLGILGVGSSGPLEIFKFI